MRGVCIVVRTLVMNVCVFSRHSTPESRDAERISPCHVLLFRSLPAPSHEQLENEDSKLLLLVRTITIMYELCTGCKLSKNIIRQS